MNPYLSLLDSYSYFQNSLLDYAEALLILIGALLVIHIIRETIVSRLAALFKRTKTDIDDMMIDSVRQLSTVFYLGIAIRMSMIPLVLAEWLHNLLIAFSFFAIAYGLIQAVNHFVMQMLQHYLQGKREENPREAAQLAAVMRFARIATLMVLWVVALLLILSNIGFDVTSLIASLGIGGIAIALALQNVLGDMFSSFSILVDKPFQVGDFIVVGDHSGTVKQIGLKTTRLKTLTGSELVIPNAELTSARVQNFKKLDRRRDLFTIGVLYETPKTKLKKIPALIEEVISKVDKATFDRAHFHQFAESSLNFEVVYFVEDKEYAVYMDVRQQIHVALFERFLKEGIEFAYPTYVAYNKKA